MISEQAFGTSTIHELPAIRRRIFAAASLIALLSIGVRLLSAGKELVIAYMFGTASQLDSFLIALVLPATLVSILASATHSAVLPVYVKVKSSRGANAANAMIGSLQSVSVIALVVLLGLCALAAPALVRTLGGAEIGGSLAQRLFVLLLPLPLLATCASLWTAALNANDRFTAPALMPALSAVAIGGGAWLYGAGHGVYALAVATVAGGAAEVAFIAAAARREGMGILPRWSGWTDDLRQIARNLTPMLAGTVMMSSTMLIDQAVAARLDAGSVSSLTYGMRLTGFITGIGSVALGTALFPHFSRMIDRSDYAGALAVFRTYAKLVLLLGIPFALCIAALSVPLVRVLFERGAFTAADTLSAARVQQLFVLQVPFYLLGIIGARLLNAFQRNDRLMQIAIVNLVLNLAGNIVLARYLGVAGIALSTTIVYACASGLMLLAIRHEVRLRK